MALGPHGPGDPVLHPGAPQAHSRPDRLHLREAIHGATLHAQEEWICSGSKQCDLERASLLGEKDLGGRPREALVAKKCLHKEADPQLKAQGKMHVSESFGWSTSNG